MGKANSRSADEANTRH